MNVSIEEIERCVRRAERRAGFHALLQGGAYGLCVGLVMSAVASLFLRLCVGVAAPTQLLAGIALLFVLATGLDRYRRREGPSALARTLDRRLNLDDRLASALEFGQRETLSPPLEAQIRDAARVARRADIGAALPMRVPRGTYFLLLGALLLGLTLFLPYDVPAPGGKRTGRPVTSSDREMAKSLRAQAEALRSAAREHRLPWLTQMADRLEKLARDIERGQADRRDALERLARLIQKLDAAKRKTPSGHLSDTLRRLAKALGQPRPANRQSLAEQLRRTARSIAREAKPSAGIERLSQKLRRAARASRGESPTDKALRKLAKSLREDNMEKAAENMRRLADQVSGEDEQRVLSRLKQQMERIKLAGIGSKRQGRGGRKRRSGGIKPGFSRDGNLFGKKTNVPNAGRTERVTGKSDAGASKGRTVAAAADDTRPSVGPQPASQSVEEAAQEFLEREDIPLSQRYRVQRYFDLIRQE